MTSSDEMLELYKTYVETITANESRRQSISALYVSLIAAAGALLASDTESNEVWIAAAILIVSVVWFLSVRYFARLARAKFDVIERMESTFSFAPFAVEWEQFKSDGASSRLGLSGWTLTRFDQVIPGLSAACSCAFLLWSLCC